MNTDWKLVRETMLAAIDACEKMEALGIKETDRSATVDVNGQSVSIFDILTSAWTYPENLRHQIIQQRHDLGRDRPYMPETARILENVAMACSELIGAGHDPAIDKACRDMTGWYREHAVPSLRAALRNT